MKQALSYLLLFAVLCSCASPPRPELNSARLAVARAYAAGAPELASSEYLAAKAALRHAEELFHQGEFQAARELLPFAAAQAREASAQAKTAKLRREQQEQARLESERQQKLQQQKMPRKQPKHKKKPPLPKPVKRRTQYDVNTKESLWDIAMREDVYSDGMLWPLLYRANRDQIKDPRQVYPGQSLLIPRQITQPKLEAARKEARESGLFKTEQHSH